MVYKNQPVTCIHFGETEIDIVTLSGNNETSLSRESFKYGFNALTSSGGIIDPERMGSFIQKIITQAQFPAKIRVGVGLKHLELRKMFFPMIPEAELHQIVIDEANRESVFSFSGETVGVAYQFINSQTSAAEVLNREILTATVPQEVINSIAAVFKNTSLKLLGIYPDLAGLMVSVDRQFSNRNDTYSFLKLASNAAEFYIFDGQNPEFWRAIQVGSSEPERLQQEIQVSLEHYGRRVTGAKNVSQMFVFGENATEQLALNLKIDYLSGEEQLDLAGLNALNQEGIFSFIQEDNQTDFAFLPILTAYLAPVLILIMLLINVWLGLRLWEHKQQILALNNNNSTLTKNLTDHQTKYQGLIKDQQKVPERFFDQLRQAVPPDLRFEQMELDLGKRQLSLDGLCIEPDSLNQFLKELVERKIVKSVSIIQADHRIRSEMDVYVFRLNMELGVPSL